MVTADVNPKSSWKHLYNSCMSENNDVILCQESYPWNDKRFDSVTLTFCYEYN